MSPRAREAHDPATGGGRPEVALAERGGATLVGLALVAVLVMVGIVGIDVGALAGARAAAQTAADMAALAALTPPSAEDGGVAGMTEGWGKGRAAEIARANGAELVRCDCSSAQAVVTVRRWLRLLPGELRVSVRAGSRAMLGGPPEVDRPPAAGRPPVASRATVQAVDL